MASARTPQRSRVFIDSSVLIAAAISATGPARELILAGFGGVFKLKISNLVLEETERNLARKAPSSIPAFELLREALAAEVVNPSRRRVLQCAKVVNLKDAPIIAAAIHAKALYLATHDKELLGQVEEIRMAFGINVASPGDVMRWNK